MIIVNKIEQNRKKVLDICFDETLSKMEELNKRYNDLVTLSNKANSESMAASFVELSKEMSAFEHTVVNIEVLVAFSLKIAKTYLMALDFQKAHSYASASLVYNQLIRNDSETRAAHETVAEICFATQNDKIGLVHYEKAFKKLSEENKARIKLFQEKIGNEKRESSRLYVFDENVEKPESFKYICGELKESEKLRRSMMRVFEISKKSACEIISSHQEFLKEEKIEKEELNYQTIA